MSENEIGRLTIVLAGQMTDLQTKFSSLEGSVKDTTGKLDDFFKKIGSSWVETAKGFIVGQFGINSINTTFNILKNTILDSVKAYDEEFVAMRQIIELAKAEAGELEMLTQTRVRATRFTEEEYRAVEKSLLLKKLNTEQIKQLMPVIEHYGALTGDLTGTANALGMAIEYGATRGLRQLGIEIDKSDSQLGIFNQLVALGAKNSGNLAEELNTGVVAGGISVSKVFGEMLENLGEFINTATPIADILRQWASGAMELIGANSKLRLIERDKKLDLEGELAVLKARQRIIKEMLEDQKTKGGAEFKVDPTAVNMLAGAYQGVKKLTEKELSALKVELEDVTARIAVGGKAASSLGTKPLGKDAGADAARAAAAAALAAQVSESTEIIGLKIEQLNVIYEKGELGPVKYYRELIKLSGDKYAAEEKALGMAYQTAQTEKEKDVILSKLGVIETKRATDKLKLLDKMAKAEIDAGKKIAEGMEKNDAEEEILLKRKMQLYWQFTEELGQVMGEMFTATGNVQSVLKEAFKGILITMLTFLEKYVLQVKLKLVLDDLMKLSFAGFITGAIKAAVISAAFAAVKAGVSSMEQGGPIRGARHSSGGVNINAEDGEYIQPRPAVNYYGPQVMEAMRRMLIPREMFAGNYNLAVAAPSGSAQTGGLMKAGAPTIVNFIDEKLFNRYINSNAGQKAIVNVIRKNQFGINR